MTAMKARRGISGEQTEVIGPSSWCGRESTSVGGRVDGGCRGERGGGVRGEEDVAEWGKCRGRPPRAGRRRRQARCGIC